MIELQFAQKMILIQMISTASSLQAEPLLDAKGRANTRRRNRCVCKLAKNSNTPCMRRNKQADARRAQIMCMHFASLLIDSLHSKQHNNAVPFFSSASQQYNGLFDHRFQPLLQPYPI
jgi:hypothetical protein